MINFLKNILQLPSKLAIILISFYQKTLSPDHGFFFKRFPAGYCRFKPTCSDYSIQALKKYGFWKGICLSLWRVLRCNPWSKGGEDRLE